MYYFMKDHSNLETCEEMMKRHKLHLNKLESILRKVDNDAIELEQVITVCKTLTITSCSFMLYLY